MAGLAHGRHYEGRTKGGIVSWYSVPKSISFHYVIKRERKNHNNLIASCKSPGVNGILFPISQLPQNHAKM